MLAFIIFELVAQLEAEPVDLKDANGRILARSVVATRDQPPFSASAMDGYAICSKDLDKGVQKWKVIGESGAGHSFGGCVTSGQATRIFTGAPMPEGTDQVIIQENALQLPTLGQAMIYVINSELKGFQLGAQGGQFYVYNMYID